MSAFALVGFGLLAARPGDPAAGAAILGGLMCYFAAFGGIFVVTAIGMWKVFEKAGRPGWAALIPIYNAWVLLEICDKPGWIILLTIVPFLGAIVSLYIAIVTSFEIANKFNRGGGFAVGLFLLPWIFYPILGFGNSEFEDGQFSRRGKKRRRVRDFDDVYDAGPPRPRRRPKRARVEKVADDYEDEPDETEDEAPPRRARAARRAPVEEDEAEDETPPPPRAVNASRPGAPATATSTLSCPGCGVKLKLPATLPSGKKVKCPKCSTTFAAP